MRAKQVVRLLLIACVFGPLLPAATVEDAILQAEKEWARAVTSRNFAALDQLLSDDLIYAHSTGVIESKQDYVGKLKSGRQRYDAIDYEKTTVKVFGDAAVAHSIVRMRGQSGGEPFDNRLMMIHTWIRQAGRWRLAAHQTTRLP